MSGNAAIITFEKVTKRYGSDALALDAVSLSVARGEFLAVVGTSGSGKTTLLQLINRLSEASEGVLRIGSDDIRALEPVALRRRMGYVFQEVGLFPHMTVAENITITPKLLGWPPERMTARAEELLGLVRLDIGYRDRFPSQLSGGERQRVGVARALAAHPDVVLMDEPFAALDPLTREALGEDYRRLHDTLGLTTVMITHDVLEALTLADRIAVLQAGRLIAVGSSEELLAHPDGYVGELMSTPRRHAKRLAGLLPPQGA
ncbi:MAG TPA: ATP-binding cassette domain-containing protein [Hyphomicrobiaceae bacterium]|nr:ATP-binding cassette domain-containing protein [Hyphomicrobiaceae bacterium]